MRLLVDHQHSQFWLILARFEEYYSPFWGPKVISMVVEPHGALTCRSSTSAVLADFGLFLALLLSFGGPGVISTIDELRGAFTVGHQHSQFWPILVCFVHYYPSFWRPRAIYMIDNPRGAFACWSSTLSVLANSDAIHGLLLTCRGPEVISMLLNPKVLLRVGHQHS